MYELLQGSIFDSKCDLLIVPCDTDGYVASGVEENLRRRGLPVVSEGSDHGQITFRRVTYEYASMLGYAASVSRQGATEKAIRAIAGKLAAYALEHELGTVNLPLLGTGAGGMHPLASFDALRDVFLRRGDGLKLRIFCLDPEVFQELEERRFGQLTGGEPPRPRVLVSYAREDPENARWVLGLARRLRRNGVDARLDVFHLKPGEEMPVWMTNEVMMADKVLLVCDRHYVARANHRRGGVGWETMIIQGDMLFEGDNRQKYIAIARVTNGPEDLPIFIRSRLSFHWGARAEIGRTEFQRLLFALFDADSAPPLGPIADCVLRQIGRRGLTQPGTKPGN